jgi:hypothetical protein
MGLTMSQRQAVGQAVATRYRRVDKAVKGVILDELCVRDDWMASQPRPQGPGPDADTEG